MAVKTLHVEGIDYQLSYELINLHHEKSILFLHGWGSNKEAMKIAFGKCFSEYRHIYLDLPGFGHSSVKMPIDTMGYTTVVSAFLKSIDMAPQIIFGHSFGGKIATLLKPNILVLLSSSGIVVPKPLSVRVKIWMYKTFKPFFPKNFYRFFATKDVDGMSSVMYEIIKKVVDEDFSPIFAKTTSQTFIFWGEEDVATPLKSGEYIHSLVQNSRFYPIHGDHFLFLKNGKNIEKLLLEFLP